MFPNSKCKTNYGCMFKCCASNREKEARNADSEASMSLNDQSASEKRTKFSIIILDFSNVEFVDDAAFKILKKLIESYKSDGIRVVLANCHGSNNERFFIIF